MSVRAGHAQASAQWRKLRSFRVAGRGYCTASKQQGKKVGKRQRRWRGKQKTERKKKTIQHQKEKAKVRTEEKIGKRAIRKKNNRKKLGKEKEQTRACGRSGGAGTERSKYKSQS